MALDSPVKVASITTVLIPVDFSLCSEAAVAFAARLGESTGARLLILHVVHDLEDAPPYYRAAAGAEALRTLPAGIALAFGANIGTCVTALLASIGRPREALRAAMVHVLFNVRGVLIWVGLIEQLAAFVQAISPVAHNVSGVEKLALESPRQIANAHTIFNVANTVLFMGFTTQFARLVEWRCPTSH